MSKYIQISKVHPDDKERVIYQSLKKAFDNFPAFKLGEYLEEEIIEDRISRIMHQLSKDSLIKY